MLCHIQSVEGRKDLFHRVAVMFELLDRQFAIQRSFEYSFELFRKWGSPMRCAEKNDTIHARKQL